MIVQPKKGELKIFSAVQFLHKTVLIFTSAYNHNIFVL